VSVASKKDHRLAITEISVKLHIGYATITPDGDRQISMEPDTLKFGEQSPVEINHCRFCGQPQRSYRSLLRGNYSSKRSGLPVAEQGGQSA
jgi:hypothetical protein